MSHPMKFTVTEQHIALLERTYVFWDRSAYEGAPAVNSKRPFGNSDVMRDIYEIIHPESLNVREEKWDEFWEFFYEQDHTDLEMLFREMEYVVQIALQCAGRLEAIEIGTYYRPDQYDTRSWLLESE